MPVDGAIRVKRLSAPDAFATSPPARYWRCNECFQCWDIDCAGTPDAVEMTAEHLSRWVCPECVCKKRKGDDSVMSLDVSHAQEVDVSRSEEVSRVTEKPSTSTDTLALSILNEIRSFREEVREEMRATRTRFEALNECIKQLADRVGICENHIAGMDERMKEVDVSRSEEVSRVTEKPSTSTDTLALSILNEIRSFREEVREEMRATRTRFEALNECIKQLADRVGICENHIAGMDERMKVLELDVTRHREISTVRLDTVDRRLDDINRRQSEAGPTTGGETVAELERTVSELKRELNDRDRHALLADLEIGQLPEVKGESTLHAVIVLAHKMGVPLDERDVVFCERVGAPPAEGGRARRVVVRLARRQLRDELLRAARVRRALLADGGARVFINERLTRPNRQLFYLAREGCRRLQWRYCWTRRGLVFARKGDGTQIHQLHSPEGVEGLFGATPPEK
ncbi:hypothetical protein ACJJTC_003267 [Scirpophaga incertulas]